MIWETRMGRVSVTRDERHEWRVCIWRGTVAVAEYYSLNRLWWNRAGAGTDELCIRPEQGVQIILGVFTVEVAVDGEVCKFTLD